MGNFCRLPVVQPRPKGNRPPAPCRSRLPSGTSALRIQVPLGKRDLLGIFALDSIESTC